MATMGFRSIEEMVGRVDRIGVRPMEHPKARTLDFGDLLRPAQRPARHDAGPVLDSVLADTADQTLLEGARISVKYGEPTTMQIHLTNADRAFGAKLAGEIARKHGEAGLPDGTVVVEATGTAGQSFGAFATRGMLIVLEGDANDYVGKGLSGGVLAVRPPARAGHRSQDGVIVGNTCLYGATSGRVFFAGQAGERFAVRNSGAAAVVEGVGAHACEYMTGGVVAVLGATGRNFGAGMSGGVAYVLDDDRALVTRLNEYTVALEAMDAQDMEQLRTLVEEHVALTRSAHGRSILASWGKRRFVKVMPHEWRRVLELRKVS